MLMKVATFSTTGFDGFGLRCVEAVISLSLTVCTLPH